jgi:plastocyanin
MADRANQVIVGGFAPAATAGGQPTPQFAFTPESITAQPGDTVRFMFLGNNHSVVQTSFEAPCKPIANGTLVY